MGEQQNSRTRAQISLTAKGTVQFEVTSEYDTPELMEKNLREGIERTRKVIADLGLKEVPLVEEKKKGNES